MSAYNIMNQSLALLSATAPATVARCDRATRAMLSALGLVGVTYLICLTTIWGAAAHHYYGWYGVLFGVTIAIWIVSGGRALAYWLPDAERIGFAAFLSAVACLGSSLLSTLPLLLLVPANVASVGQMAQSGEMSGIRGTETLLSDVNRLEAAMIEGLWIVAMIPAAAFLMCHLALLVPPLWLKRRLLPVSS